MRNVSGNISGIDRIYGRTFFFWSQHGDVKILTAILVASNEHHSRI